MRGHRGGVRGELLCPRDPVEKEGQEATDAAFTEAIRIVDRGGGQGRRELRGDAPGGARGPHAAVERPGAARPAGGLLIEGALPPPGPDDADQTVGDDE